MKASILLSLLLAGTSLAGFESWTSADGRSAELDLIQVTEKDGEKVGTFRMRNGRTTTLKASQLAEEDAKRLNEWKSPAEAAAAAAGPSSVFDDVLEGNLLSLQGKSLKRHKEAVQPQKYYLFYYTASWCGPCQSFTPSLVEFYDDHKNEDFEIVLVTSDRSEDDMEGYAKSKKMTWPHLKMSKVEKFRKEFRHPGGGIPNLVLTDLDGNILKSSYEGSKYLGPTVVMKHLGKLLKN